MKAELNNCPCSGKNMNYFLGPWILMAIHIKKEAHGFEIKKILEEWLKDTSVSFNISGIYRHLKAFEERGVVNYRWDISENGHARKRYFLTETGRECLFRWIKTLTVQEMLINDFLNKASKLKLILGVEGI